MNELGTRTSIHYLKKRTLLGTARILCFESEEMNFKGPFVLGYHHDWPHWELYLYEIIAYNTLFTDFLLSLCAMNDSITFFSLSNCSDQFHFSKVKLK